MAIKMFGKNKFSGSIEYLVVGLGNPDKKYENTRHNTGWLALDYIADKYNCKVNKIKYKSFVGNCTIGGAKVMLMKPTTYMNNSGQAVVEAMNFYKIPPENVIVIFDDISLDVGKMRIRSKGSDGGQKGMRSIIYLSSSENFPRIKIGLVQSRIRTGIWLTGCFQNLQTMSSKHSQQCLTTRQRLLS